MDNLLTVSDLSISYLKATHPTISHLSFTVNRGEIVGIVGPSGCGKTTVTKAILGIIDSFEPVTGTITFNEDIILGQSVSTAQDYWWKDISIVSQTAMSSFNPSYTIFQSIKETLVSNGDTESVVDRAKALMHMVHLEAHVLNMFPHQLSGGMKQRASIALALALNPKLVILDEATTGLDKLVEAKILKIIVELKQNIGTSFILISHDQRIIDAVCDKVIRLEELSDER